MASCASSFFSSALKFFRMLDEALAGQLVIDLIREAARLTGTFAERCNVRLEPGSISVIAHRPLTIPPPRRILDITWAN